MAMHESVNISSRGLRLVKHVRLRALAGLLLACLLAAGCGGGQGGDGLVSLPGQLPTDSIAHAKLLGPLDPTTPMRLALTVPPHDVPPALGSADPAYQHYLTPEEFTALYGPTQEQYDAVVAFARSQGLTITYTSPGRALLDVTGTAAAVEAAFGIRLVNYRGQDGRVFYAPDRDPRVPAAIARLHVGIVGLDNAAVGMPGAAPAGAAARARGAAFRLVER